MSTYGFAKYSLEYLGFTSAGFFAGADEIRALGCERWQGEAAEQLNFGFGAHNTFCALNDGFSVDALRRSPGVPFPRKA